MAIFHGSKIGNSQFEIRPQSTDAGLSAIFTSPDNIKGEFYSMDDEEVIFSWTSAPVSVSFYIDGIKQKAFIKNNQMTVRFPKENIFGI